MKYLFYIISTFFLLMCVIVISILFIGFRNERLDKLNTMTVEKAEPQFIQDIKGITIFADAFAHKNMLSTICFNSERGVYFFDSESFKYTTDEEAILPITQRWGLSHAEIEQYTVFLANHPYIDCIIHEGGPEFRTLVATSTLINYYQGLKFIVNMNNSPSVDGFLYVTDLDPENPDALAVSYRRRYKMIEHIPGTKWFVFKGGEW